MQSGIYEIKNIKTGARYIGKAKNVFERKRTHFYNLKKGNHCNQYLQHSFNKHGKKFFIFSIIYYTSYNDEKSRIKLEQTLLNNLKKTDYNICKISGTTEGFKSSQESKDKMSKARKAYYKNNPQAFKRFQKSGRLWVSKNGQPFKGKKHKPEAKKKLSKALKKYYQINPGKVLERVQTLKEWFKVNGNPFLGKVHSEETKKKASKRMKKKVEENPNALDNLQNGREKWALENDNPFKGKKHSKKSKKRMSQKASKYHDILQIDKKTGEILKTHETPSDAIQYLGIKTKATSHIVNACKKPKTRSAYGYNWKFKYPEKYIPNKKVKS